MEIHMSNTEFHNAMSSLTFHHAPNGYWEQIDEQRKKHPFVGHKAITKYGVLECVRAEDDLIIFRLSPSAEYIVGKNHMFDIKWI